MHIIHNKENIIYDTHDVPSPVTHTNLYLMKPQPQIDTTSRNLSQQRNRALDALCWSHTAPGVLGGLSLVLFKWFMKT